MMNNSRVQEQLHRLAVAFVSDVGERYEFIIRYMEKAEALVAKAKSLGYAEDKLELIYVPADMTFQEMQDKFCKLRLREPKRYKEIEWGEEVLWAKKAEAFGDYGIKDTPQLLAMIHGDDTSGLWLTKKKVGEQIAHKPEGLDFLTPAAYVCANIVRAANSDGNCADDLLDYNEREWVFTRFPQYSLDGFVKAANGQYYVPYAYLYAAIRFYVDGSYGEANWYSGVRFVVRE